jgi:hypothetical protein
MSDVEKGGEDNNQSNSMRHIQKGFEEGVIGVKDYNYELKSHIENGETFNHKGLDIKSSINIYKRKWEHVPDSIFGDCYVDDFDNEDKNPIAIVLIAHDGTVDIDVLDNDYRRCWWSGDSRAYLKKDSDGSPIGAYHEDSGWARKNEGVNNADV